MIYCDHNASTRVRGEVLDAMLRVMRDGYGNASSVHAAGSRARCAVEDARAHVAALVAAHPMEIVFTGGGTEANNLAVLGSAAVSPQRTILSTPIEHASVRAPIAHLVNGGWTLREIAVDQDGLLTTQSLQSLLDDDVAFVSIGWANNEIGTVQPIAELARACRGIRFHSDAVQAIGKIPVRVDGLDLLSMSAHKIGGPQGVGALYVRRGIDLQPLQLGGGQERGRRAGTENVAAIVGMGEAGRLALLELAAFAEACVALRDGLWARLQQTKGVRRNGAGNEWTLPNTLNVSFAGVRGEALVAALDLAGIAVSSGSACAAGAGEPSHVLQALGRSGDEARDGVRFSFGASNSQADVEAIAAATMAAVERIRGSRQGVA